MNEEILVERLFQTLVTGDRAGAREIVGEARSQQGASAELIAHRLYWPVIEHINQLFRSDQLSTLAHHYAVRVLRSLVDQGQASYLQESRRTRRILMFSGASEADDLAGQLVADLLEADGYEVFFGGGGVAADEILEEVGARSPDILLMFASGAPDAPIIRQIIDAIREVGARPNLQIVVGGGVFNRAPGLAEEIGADLWAARPEELLAKLDSLGERRAAPEQRTVGRNRRVPRAKVA